MLNPNQNKKLLLVGPTDGSVHVRNYYHLIKNYFDDVLVVTMQPIDFCKYELADFSMRNPIGIRKKIKRIRKIINDYKPDIIHVHQANSCPYLTIRANRKKIPLVVTCWGSDVLLMPQMGIVHKHVVKYVLRHADVITADAKYMAEAIKNLGEKKQVVIANFGIELSSELLIPEKENIIYSNRLHKDVYNIDRIILAFEKFISKHPDWKLVIGATGDFTEDLKKMATSKLPKGTFEFIGFVNTEENRNQYLQSKIWVSIPSSDGTSISLLEAMGYGCIPVVSNLPANKEWITANQNGIIVGNDLADSFEDALKLSAKNVQEINQKIILERGTKEVNRNLFFKIYDSILG